MATTTNFGWETPDDTDLVKDGAAAIRTALGGVDTSFVDLKGGTTGQVLAKASATDLDFVWSADSSGGQTQIATGSLTGATVNINSIPGTYRDLKLVITNFLPATDAQNMLIRFNADSTSYARNSTAETLNTSFAESAAILTVNSDNGAGNDKGIAVATIPEYTNTTTYKLIVSQSVTHNATTPANINVARYWGVWDNTAAITAINLLTSSGNFTSGTYTLYGVK